MSAGSGPGLAHAEMRQTPPMSNIDIYQVLRKIPNVSDDEAKQAADLMAGIDQAVTKADLIAQERRLEAKMIKLAIWTVAANVTLTVSLVKLL